MVKFYANGMYTRVAAMIAGALMLPYRSADGKHARRIFHASTAAASSYKAALTTTEFARVKMTIPGSVREANAITDPQGSISAPTTPAVFNGIAFFGGVPCPFRTTVATLASKDKSGLIAGVGTTQRPESLWTCLDTSLVTWIHSGPTTRGAEERTSSSLLTGTLVKQPPSR